MNHSGANVIGVLVVCLLAWAPAAAAQAVPACDPAKTLNVTLTSEERSLPAPLVATHDVSVSGEISGITVNESFALPADVKVLAANRGGVNFIVPIAASVPITVSWHQGMDPSDPHSDPDDPATRCAASRVVTLPITPARPTHAVKLRGWKMSQRLGASVFAVVPALKQPDLSPLEISIRTSSRARLPSPNAAARTMVVPMRTVDQIEYRKKLPSLFFIKTPRLLQVLPTRAAAL